MRSLQNLMLTPLLPRHDDRANIYFSMLARFEKGGIRFITIDSMFIAIRGIKR